MSVTNSESDSGSVKDEILLQHKLIEASKNKSKSNSKKLLKSPDSPSKNKMLKTERTKKRLQLKKVTNDSKSDSEDSEKELEIMKSALKQIKEKKAKGKMKTGSISDNETKNDITLKLSDSTIMPLTTSTPNINSKLIQAASLSTKKGVLQKILADSNNVVKNLIKQGKANTKSNSPTKQLKGILKTSLQNIKNNQSDDSDSSSDKLPPSQWQSFQKKEMEESSDSEASFSNAISSTQIPQSQKSFDSDNGNKAQPVVHRRQSITKNVSFDDSNLDEDNVKQSPKNKLQLKSTNDSGSDSDVSLEKVTETNSAQNNGQSSSDTSSSESEDKVDTTTVTNMKQIQKNEPVKTIFANTKSASDSDSDNNLSKKFTQNNNIQTESTKSSSEDDSSESEDKSSRNEVTVKPNNISASKNDSKSSSEDERDDNEKTMNKNVVNTGAKSDKVSSDSDNETKADTSSSADEASDSESSEPEMRKDVKSVAQKSMQNESSPQKQSSSGESSSDSDDESQSPSKKQGKPFISQQKLHNFPQIVFQQKNILKDMSGSDNESSSDVSMNEAVKSPNKMQRKKRQREEISASESSDDEPKKRVSKLCDLSIVDTEPLLNTSNSETMYNSLKEYIITNPDLKKIDAKTNLLLEDLNEDEEVWLMQCPKVLAPNLLVGQKLKLDKNVKLKMKVGSNKYECISERSSDLNICVVASESARNQNLAAKIVKPAGTIVIHQMLKEKSPVRIETPDRARVEAPANLKTRHPIFGVNYENKIKLDEATHDKLITAELERRKAEKKALKKKRRESVSRANEKDTSINKDEMIYQLLNQTKSSINGTASVDKKKSKKRKLSESKEENIAKVQKIDNLEKSEVDSSTKHSAKPKRKSKKSISISEDINDNKFVDMAVNLQESVIENLLESQKMEMKSPQSAEKSKKKRKEKFSNNEQSIVNENEADSSNSAGKKNRKKNKNKKEANLEGIEANMDERVMKSNETKLESILASISDTMINDTTVKKKQKKNKHKDENRTMESQNASHEEKSLDNSSIFEYQENVFNGGTKKSHKNKKNKYPKDPKPSTDDTVTYSNVENITEIVNNVSTVSEDSTSKRKHKKKKKKSVNSEETPAFNDSTKLSIGNEELNVKSKKKHANKNKSVNGTNNEAEEMEHFTPKKNHKHVEESPDKSSELSTSITKKKSQNKSRASDNFDKNQVINDLLSSIMQNTNGHCKDKSKKQKRQNADNIEKQIADVNEHLVEVKHKKKSKKKHEKD